MQARFTPVLAGLVLLASPGPCGWGWAQAPSYRIETLAHEMVPAGLHVMTGRLERREQQYVLVDEGCDLETHLIARPSLDLDRYVGETVALSVREPQLRQEGASRVWVDRIALATERTPHPGSSRPADRGPQWPVALAQLTEPILDEELAIPGVPMPGLGEPSVTVPGVAMPGVAVPLDGAVSPCGRPGWIWAGAEYLMWRTDGMHIPALVTTSPAGTPRAEAGVLGEAGTSILYGDRDLFDGNTNGARVYAGLYFDRQSAVGIQGDYLWLQTQSDDFLASSNASGTPILARPFFNVNPRNPLTLVFDPPAREDSRLASYPGAIRGTIAIDADSHFQSIGLALRSVLACESFSDAQRTAYTRVDMITGYRYMQLEDNLQITEDLSTLDQLPLVSFQVFDQFDACNQLHAIDVGANWQGGWQRFSLDLTLKTAFGLARQEVTILGGTTVAQTGSSASYPGGVLALPSNIGLHARDRFTVVPELGATAGFQITRNIRATLGYNFIFWGSVLRAGDHIDLDINPDQMPPPIVPLAGAVRPAFAFQESTYWAQGITAGIEGRW